MLLSLVLLPLLAEAQRTVGQVLIEVRDPAGAPTDAAGVLEIHALSPRLSGSWFAAPLGLVVHASYNRTFETPPIENILLASANVVDDLGGEGESLAIEPSRGHFFETGFSKQLFDRVRLDGTVFSRRATNMVDDDLLLNTGVSFRSPSPGPPSRARRPSSRSPRGDGCRDGLATAT